MKTKDLVYVGIIAYLAYLLMKKKPLATTTTQDATLTGSTPNSANLPSGGLTLGQNMDLPNLTPTAPNGMSTEVALNSSNISPLIKDDGEPTQVFGNYNLPPAYGASTITSNPIDTVATTTYPTASTTEYPTASTTEYPTDSTTEYPTDSTIEYPTASTIEYPTDSTIEYPPALTTEYPTDLTKVVPVGNVRDFESIGTTPRPVKSATSIITEPSLILEVPNQESLSVYSSPRPQLDYTSPVKNERTIMTEEVLPVEDLPVYNSPRPIKSAVSIISEPMRKERSIMNKEVLSVKSGGSVITQPNLEARKTIIAEPVKDQIISECGNSFSIPNNDREGSYTNYWFDGSTYFMQTTSPLLKTIASKISKDLFVEGCKKYQSFKLQNS